MSSKGISLEPGLVVVLALDGTMVYVEEIRPTFAAVVALPEQFTASSGLFTPGRVGAKKISPFSSVDREVPIADLSELNKEFIGTFESLRKTKGPNFTFGKAVPVMTVAKAGPIKRTLTSKCGTCGQQPGHPNHPSKHEFLDDEPTKPAKTVDVKPAKTVDVKPAKTVKRSSTDLRVFMLQSSDLTQALTQPRGERYLPGNRFFRVVQALASLPQQRGTVEEIMAAMSKDGGKTPANPAKITSRVLRQLQKPAFGSCVTEEQNASPGGGSHDDDDDDDE